MAIVSLSWTKDHVPALALGEVHIWQANLAAVTDIMALYEVLSADEKERASRLRFNDDKHHFIIGRGILRHLLASYLTQLQGKEVCPAAIKLQQNAHGKPFLAYPDMALDFNLSHSHGLALYAFALQRRLGIDIEYSGRNCAINSVAKYIFTPLERQIWQNLLEEQKVKAFFNAWTRKEALVKALGQGLSFSLKNCAVSFMPDEKPELLALDYSQNIADWQLYHLQPAPGFVGALVISKAHADS